MEDEKKPKVIVYVGVFLTLQSREHLLKLVTPRHETIFAHHTTVRFKPTSAQMESYIHGVAFAEFGNNAWPIIKLGDTITFQAVAIAHDEKGQAVRVRGVPSENEFPHITISCAKGVKPVYSNELLKGGKLEYFDDPIELVGVLDTFPSSNLSP